MAKRKHLLIAEYHLRGANDGNTRMTLELYDEDGAPDWQISQIVAKNLHAQVIIHTGGVAAEVDEQGIVTRVFVADAAYETTPLASMADA